MLTGKYTIPAAQVRLQRCRTTRQKQMGFQSFYCRPEQQTGRHIGRPDPGHHNII